MSDEKYTAEQMMREASGLESHGYVAGPAMLRQAAQTERAYAATMRQQAGRVDDVSFSTVEKVVKALCRIGHTFPESKEEQAARFEGMVLDLCRSVQQHFDALSAQPAPERQGEACLGIRARVSCSSESEWFVELVHCLHTVRTAPVFPTRENAEAYLSGINLWLHGGDSPNHPTAPVGVPDGWVPVPREPTVEMQAAHAIHGDTSDWWNAVIAAAPSAPQAAPVGVPEPIPLDDDVREILGRMCFQCIRLANRLRQLGHVIESRAEAEQASVLHWMLNHYLKHGKEWHKFADAELNASAPREDA